MADKNRVIREPVLRDCQFTVETDASGTYVSVACPQEGGVAGATRVNGADLTAAQRAAGQTFLLALLNAAKVNWGGYGA